MTEGPVPGTRLQEGHYAISFSVLVVGDTQPAKPIATCRVGYDVEGKARGREGISGVERDERLEREGAVG